MSRDDELLELLDEARRVVVAMMLQLDATERTPKSDRMSGSLACDLLAHQWRMREPTQSGTRAEQVRRGGD